MNTIIRHVVFGIGGLGLVGLVGATSIACTNDAEQGRDGAPGSQGAQGEPGPAGTPGTAGTSAPETPPANAGAPKAVYTLGNDATANAVYVFSRAADGALTPKEAYATGGKGAGAGLGDQGALVFDAAKNLFFAVNAGDDSISMLRLETDGSLSLVSKIGSGGVKPISVTVSGDLVYVLNAGDGVDDACISGFRVTGAGLVHITDSTRPLSAAAPAPAQIQFAPDGKTLVVTEKGTDTIDTYLVSEGVAGTPISQPSQGKTPFGFAFDKSGHLIVSEAFGGADGAGATSSYTIDASGMLSAKSPSVASAQSAPCWVAVTGSRAWVTNTKTNNVTGYSIAADGMLTLLANGNSGMTGMNPIDVDATDDDSLLYTLNAKGHSISVFAIGADGALSKKPDFAGVPEFAVGLVAR
jgi:6-phosphogluconolactonase